MSFLPDPESAGLMAHKDGVPWWEAPIPRWWHRCRPQTVGMAVERCACGSINTPFGWHDRNSRRRRR